MIRKLSVTILFLMLASFFAVIPVQAAKSYYAERFDIYIEIQKDGSAIITETVDFHFEGDPFTFAFREVSGAETDGITFLDASTDGVPMPQGTQPGQVEIEAGEPLKVTWHFAPTSGSTHTFTVRYRADGVIRKGDADTLIWRTIPEDHDYPINSSTIRLSFPQEASLLEPPTLNREFEFSSDGNQVVLVHGGLAEDEDLILTAHFSPDSVTGATPRWQAQGERADAAFAQGLPLVILAGLATLILGGLGLFVLIRANGREVNLDPLVLTANPPADLSPAIVGKLTGQSHNLMGSVFDLAARGVLEVEQEKSFWGKKHILVRKDPGISLKLFEQELLDALFERGHNRINMNEVASRLALQTKSIEQPLEEELIWRGWLDPERKQKRTWLSVSSLSLMVLSVVAFIISMAGGGISLARDPSWLPGAASLMGISAGAFILSILLLIYATTFSTLTPAGEEQSARWKGFAEYLKRVCKGREPVIRPDTFERYLAYAAVFGLGAAWAKHFQKLGGAPLPTWFHTMDGMDGDFGAMVAVMYASDTAGAGGDGGGGGASGGGSSGAG